MFSSIALTSLVLLGGIALIHGIRDNWVFPDHNYHSIVGGRQAAAPPEDDPVAFVIKDDHFSKVYGRREGKYPNSYYRFYGMRYAEPPVGRYRFQRAKKLKMEGEVFGYKSGPPCPQPDPDNPKKIIGSEDCLFLNIFTPKLPDAEEGMLPVLLWIHGGGFRRGSGSQYGGGLLARRDVIVVTVQYRLGSLGFLSTGQKELPGNAAMFDLATAVSWLKEYIEYFGGDPNNIIPFGQGTGASSAMTLGFSNVTQSRMAGVIAMSGSALSPFAIDEHPSETAVKLAKKNGCPESPILSAIKCLQQLPVENLISSDSWMEDLTKNSKGFVGVGDLMSPGPVVEDQFDQRALPPYLAEEPRVTLNTPHHIGRVPLLTGVTKHETAGAVTGGFKDYILDSLKNVPNFVNEVLVPDLLKKQLKNLYSIPATGANALKTVTGNYLQFRPKSLEDGLSQVIEATSDALFNFPAFQTSNAWLKHKLPVFFYSFEHQGKLKGVEKLLRGSILVNKDQDDEKIGAVSHGTDLPYLFDIRSLDGTPDPVMNESTPLDPEDQKVRDVFLDLISHFAKTKGVRTPDGKKPAGFPSYISILPNLNVGDKYRDCQMSLWSGIKPNGGCPPLKLLTGTLVKGLGGIASGAGGLLKNKTILGGIGLG